MAISNPLISNIPIGNPVTKEVLQEQLPISTDTPYSTTYTKQPYTELKTYYFEPTQEGTYTQIVSDDFIMTGVIATIEQRANTKTHILYLNDTPLYMITTAVNSPAILKVDFPPVLVRKNSVFRLEATESGGATTLTTLHSIIGYMV